MLGNQLAYQWESMTCVIGIYSLFSKLLHFSPLAFPTKHSEFRVIYRYLKERKQFGAPLAAFQINQQKLVQMLGNIQAMILVGWRLCKLYENGKMTPGQASLGKVFYNTNHTCYPPSPPPTPKKKKQNYFPHSKKRRKNKKRSRLVWHPNMF